MLSGHALAQALTACQPHAVAFRGLAYRAVHLRYFHNFSLAKPLYAATGGPGTRFVPPASQIAALYAAFDHETADREMNQIFHQTLATPVGPALAATGGLRPEPAVTLGVYLDLTRLLDLRVPTILNLLQTNAARLLAPWKGATAPTATQQLGEAVFRGNWFEGIIYPSAQNPNHHCFVLFPLRFVAKPAVHFRGFRYGTGQNAAVLGDDQLP